MIFDGADSGAFLLDLYHGGILRLQGNLLHLLSGPWMLPTHNAGLKIRLSVVQFRPWAPKFCYKYLLLLPDFESGTNRGAAPTLLGR